MLQQVLASKARAKLGLVASTEKYKKILTRLLKDTIVDSNTNCWKLLELVDNLQ